MCLGMVIYTQLHKGKRIRHGEDREICMYNMHLSLSLSLYLYTTWWRGVGMINPCDVLFVAFDVGLIFVTHPPGIKHSNGKPPHS